MSKVRVCQFTVSKRGDLLRRPFFMMLDVETGVFGSRYGSEETAQAAADTENEKRRL
ncbi:hypothetical protein LCGC14_2850960 [marine sediment metagenome]|uniref:Mandelate racemase/muconate lactonizing enzyme N-terminal domain-containing protein n=1 Tax=marine sediment metagenome TaxID=412755 RepID=A0A0F8YV64_9ZZZZ